MIINNLEKHFKKRCYHTQLLYYKETWSTSSNMYRESVPVKMYIQAVYLCKTVFKVYIQWYAYQVYICNNVYTVYQ